MNGVFMNKNGTKMNTAKIYHDLEGSELTIWQMIKREPEWAANRLQEGEKAIEQMAELKADIKTLYAEFLEKFSMAEKRFISKCYTDNPEGYDLCVWDKESELNPMTDCGQSAQGTHKEDCKYWCKTETTTETIYDPVELWKWVEEKLRNE